MGWMRVGLFAAMLAGTSWNAHAGDEVIPQLEDFLTFQGIGEKFLEPYGIGVNLTRYHWTGLPTDEYMLLPGYGLRGTFGRDTRLELLGKLSLGGYLGGGAGPYVGDDGTGFAAAAWYGAGLVGMESSWYWGDGGMETELGVYLAIQFGSKNDGVYRFRNWVIDFLRL